MRQRRLTVLGSGETKTEAVRAATILSVFSLHGFAVEYTRVPVSPDVVWVLDPTFASRIDGSRLVVYDDIVEHKGIMQEAGALILNHSADVILCEGAFITRGVVRDNALDKEVANELLDDVISIARGLAE